MNAGTLQEKYLNYRETLKNNTQSLVSFIVWKKKQKKIFMNWQIASLEYRLKGATHGQNADISIAVARMIQQFNERPFSNFETTWDVSLPRKLEVPRAPETTYHGKIEIVPICTSLTVLLSFLVFSESLVIISVGILWPLDLGKAIQRLRGRTNQIKNCTRLCQTKAVITFIRTAQRYLTLTLIK